MWTMSKRSMSEILGDIAEILKDADRMASAEGISKDGGLDRNAVKKYLDNVEKFMESGRLREISRPQLDTWVLVRLGFLSLSEERQINIVREQFPKPSEDDRVLARLFLAGAVDKSRPFDLDLPSEDLLKKGFVKRASNDFYLTERGQRIARGVLKTYPEVMTD